MVSETGDVQSFLAQHPPFNSLTEKQLEFAGNNIYVAFNKSGSELASLRVEGTDHKAGMLVVRSGSLEIRDAENRLIDRLSTGDYLVLDTLEKNIHNPRIIVLEDCLYYELTEQALRSLAADSSEISALCKTESARKIYSLHQADVSDSSYQTELLTKDVYLTQQVKDTMSGNIISVTPGTTIRQAAQTMKEHRISSLLIMDNSKLAGIVTDRDLRMRVLAEGVADNESINSVMTPEPICIDYDSRLHDVQLTMMSEGVHHIPVLQDGRPVGIITPTDILRVNRFEPLSLVRAISRAGNIQELGMAAGNIPALMVRLIERHVRAIEVGKIITTLTDNITRRLLVLSEQKYGTPPCDYAWLAFGSQARQEQVLGSDQDNALLLPDNVGTNTDDAIYFRDFAAFVNDGLAQCGMPYCPGDIMASNNRWRLTLAGWKACFSHWIEEPTPEAVMHSSIFFDMRHIAGNANLTRALRDYVLERASDNTIFLAMMCENALLHSPPLGFFKTFVLENDGDHINTLNLKQRGTIPIVDIARNYTLAAGLRPLNTIERLKAIEEAGDMSREMAYSLIDAHEFIAGIRLNAQGKQYREGRKPDNYLDPRELSPLMRHQIKDAFHIVREGQNAMKVRFGGGVI